MDANAVMAYCAALPHVTCDYPFGEQPACYRLANKIIVMVYSEGVAGALQIVSGNTAVGREVVKPMMLPKHEPLFGEFMRKQFPQSIYRPYHTPPVQQPYASTVILDGSVPEVEIKQMIDHAYTYILHKLPKKLQAELKLNQH